MGIWKKIWLKSSSFVKSEYYYNADLLRRYDRDVKLTINSEIGSPGRRITVRIFHAHPTTNPTIKALFFFFNIVVIIFFSVTFDSVYYSLTVTTPRRWIFSRSLLFVSDRLQPVWNATNGEIGNVVFSWKIYYREHTILLYVWRLFLYDRVASILYVYIYLQRIYGTSSFRLFGWHIRWRRP